MRIPYKSYPVGTQSSALPLDKIRWLPVLPVRLVDKHMQSKTKSFHAIVDSGSTACVFHSSFLESLGVALEQGILGNLGSIGAGQTVSVFYHDVTLLVAQNWRVELRAAFTPDLAVAGILGRYGFFDTFRVQFDHSSHPPVVEINYIASP